MNYWVGVIVGCVMGIVMSLITVFCIIKQNNSIEAQVKELTELVTDHERIMRAYEFYNWQYSLKMEEEK